MKTWSNVVLCCGAALASLAAPAWAQDSQAAPACGSDALGTARTLLLEREYVGYGREQYGPLPLNKGEVVLTFDDGPVPGTLDRVLAALAAQCVKASFFMTGANLASYPELGRRVLEAGHTAALHSHAHPALGSLPPAAQLADLELGLRSFADVFGTAPAAYRFPFLQETPTMLAALKEKKITVASMDMNIRDYHPNDMRSETLVARLAAQLDQSGGGILLMHDANGPTADALPALLKTIKDKGYKVVHLRWAEAKAAPADPGQTLR